MLIKEECKMLKRLLNICCGLVLLTSLLALSLSAGCQEARQQQVPTTFETAAHQTDIIMSDYASAAVNAAGSLEAWMQVRQMQVNCVVTLYQPDGSYYLTSQRHKILPWSNAIQIRANEPQAKIFWQLSDNQFTTPQGSAVIDAMPEAITSDFYARALRDIVTAPIRLLDAQAEFIKTPDRVHREGLWYKPIGQTGRYGDSVASQVLRRWSSIVFYQNSETSLVDMLWFVDVQSETYLAVRGYDYHQFEETGIRVPAKVEIFETDANGVFQNRLAKIDYK